MNAATYTVVVVVQVGPEPDDVRFFPFGTAFAVGNRLLATNAHVTEGILDPLPVPIREVVAVQSGTGEVFRLLRGLTHPDYNGRPLWSPDVGLFTTDKVLPTSLTIATEEEVRFLEVGDELLLTGFPGDVADAIPIVPGVTVPQATSLTGRITALRSYRLDAEITPETVDVFQHQAPTTAGTSGSALVHCGRVVAVHNAGTQRQVVSVLPDGNQRLEIQSAASNNFGAHVRYLTEMLSLFGDQAVQGFEIPPPFNPAGAMVSAGPGREEQPAAASSDFAGTYTGRIDTPPNARHEFTLVIASDGSITGTSTWPQTGDFTLTGTVNEMGEISFTDDSPRIGFNQGIYQGVFTGPGQIVGQYFEGSTDNLFGNWTAVPQTATASPQPGQPPPAQPPPQPPQPVSPACADLSSVSSYSGVLMNLTASAQANVSITFNQSGCQVTGALTIAPPLRGSGPLQGQIQGDRIGFTVPGTTNDAGVDIRFGGIISGNQISGEFIVESQQQAGTWQVSASDASSSGGIPAPVPPSAPSFAIDWGELENHFIIENVRVEPQQLADPLGRVRESLVIAFTVEARGTGLRVAGFQARFIDQDGIEVDRPVALTFQPDYSTGSGWRPGLRSRGIILLPLQEILPRVRVVRVTGLP